MIIMKRDLSISILFKKCEVTKMNKTDENPFISFYGEHNISPVHQNIENIREHLLRREKLYQKLGLASIAFKNKTILEIGPGGGYNSIVFFKWGAKVDFVEPNPKAQEELPVLLEEHGIPKGSWKLFKNKIENYGSSKVYDIVIAEGFIPGLPNRAEVIEKIKGLVNPGGVAVVTCIDDISFFFENLKRLVATKLIKDINDFWQKINILSKAFLPHLRKLKYSTRPVEDYVIDQFLNPALYCQLFSIADCIKEFGNEFLLLGSSPQMFSDYSWYKDLDFDFHDSALKQFNQKRHVLIMTGLEESKRDARENEQLFKVISEIRVFSKQMEQHPSRENIQKVINLIKKVNNLTSGIDSRITKAIDEAVVLIADNDVNVEKVAGAHNFGSAFGRGQQYVSMVKKFTY